MQVLYFWRTKLLVGFCSFISPPPSRFCMIFMVCSKQFAKMRSFERSEFEISGATFSGQKEGGQVLVGGLDCTVHRNYFGSQVITYALYFTVCPKMLVKTCFFLKVV